MYPRVWAVEGESSLGEQLTFNAWVSPALGGQCGTLLQSNPVLLRIQASVVK